MNDKPRWLDRPGNVNRLVYGLYLLGAVLFVGDLLYLKHPHFEMEGVFGFYAIYGFVACVVLVVLAKQLRRLLMRKEDYYDAAPPPPPEARKP